MLFLKNINIAGRYKNAEDIEKMAEEGVPQQLVRLNMKTFELEDYFQFPKGHGVSSVQFIHRKGESKAERPGIDGYIAVPMLNQAELDGVENVFREVWLFDAANLKQGPVCVLTHPQFNYGFMLHCVWTDSIEPHFIKHILIVFPNWYMVRVFYIRLNAIGPNTM